MILQVIVHLVILHVKLVLVEKKINVLEYVVLIEKQKMKVNKMILIFMNVNLYQVLLKKTLKKKYQVNVVKNVLPVL